MLAFLGISSSSLNNLEEDIKTKKDEVDRLLKEAQDINNKAQSEKSKVDDQKQKNAEAVLIFDDLVTHIENKLNKLK